MVDVTVDMVERLLHEEEGASLDFKRDQYELKNATEHQKSKLIKDILAFANAFRRDDAFILIGVEECRGGRSTPVGIRADLDDADIQQLVNSKTNKPVVFSYRTSTVDEVKIGVIHIPLQDRPFYLKNDFGPLRRKIVYLRRGSSTDEALPEEIGVMCNDPRQQVADTYETIRIANTRRQFQWLINRIITTIHVNNYYPGLYDLKQFFLANPEYYALEANKKFFDEWLMKGQVEMRVTSSTAWTKESYQKLQADIRTLEEV